MNEFNIDEEEPDQHWEGFKKLLYLIGLLLILFSLALNYC